VSKSNGRQGPEDTNEIAFRVVQQLTGQVPKEDVPVSELSAKRAEAGRQGGLKGGQARAEKLSDASKSEIARNAALKRWSKKSVIDEPT